MISFSPSEEQFSRNGEISGLMIKQQVNWVATVFYPMLQMLHTTSKQLGMSLTGNNCFKTLKHCTLALNHTKCGFGSESWNLQCQAGCYLFPMSSALCHAITSSMRQNKQY